MIALSEAPTAPAPAARSENQIITDLQKTISASRLSLLLQCRLKFWFRYVAGLTKPKTPALHLGGSVHQVLKAWNMARWKGTPMSLKQLHDVYQTSWKDLEEEPVAWNEDEEDQQKTGWRLLETYFRESNIPSDAKPEAVEVPVEANLQRHGLPHLIGVIDLVHQNRIIDFKTNSQTPNADKWPIPTRCKPAHTHCSIAKPRASARAVSSSIHS